MSASNAFETDLLEHIFQNAAIANIGDAGGLQPSAAAGSLYISLHTGDPGEAGDQTTSEAAYTSYARVAVARSAGGWTIADNAVDNAAAVVFPEATGGSETITHFGIGTASSAAGNLLFSGALDASLAVSSGITPSFAIGELNVTDD
jgi:nucleoside phosphorylase